MISKLRTGKKLVLRVLKARNISKRITQSQVIPLVNTIRVLLRGQLRGRYINLNRCGDTF